MHTIHSDVKLSPNFYLREFLRSDRAARLGRLIEANDEEVERLRLLCVEVMEPIRTHMGGRVITITSGFRPLWLNQATPGSSKTSDHMTCDACDYIVAGYTPFQVCRAVSTIIHQLPIKQLIYEFSSWIHTSRQGDGATPRRQLITAHHVDGNVRYSAGIIDHTVRRVA